MGQSSLRQALMGLIGLAVGLLPAAALAESAQDDDQAGVAERMERRALEINDPDGLYIAARLWLLAGETERALTLFTDAALADHPGAMGTLGGASTRDRLPNVPADEESDWLRRAAEAGYAPAMVRLVDLGQAEEADFGDLFPSRRQIARGRTRDARLIRDRAPRNVGASGDCTLQWAVDTQGETAYITAMEDCAPEHIAPSIAAVETYRYRPARIDGMPEWRSGIMRTFTFTN